MAKCAPARTSPRLRLFNDPTGGCWLRSAHYKALVKALVKAALGPMDVQQAKDVEVCLAGVRADKVKEETAAKAAKKGPPLLITCLNSGSISKMVATVLGPALLGCKGIMEPDSVFMCERMQQSCSCALRLCSACSVRSG